MLKSNDAHINNMFKVLTKLDVFDNFPELIANNLKNIQDRQPEK